MNRERTAKLLKELRGKKSVEEVANALGVSVSSVTKYESGERFPTDQIKKKYADLFGRTVQFLFFRD